MTAITDHLPIGGDNPSASFRRWLRSPEARVVARQLGMGAAEVVMARQRKHILRNALVLGSTAIGCWTAGSQYRKHEAEIKERTRRTVAALRGARDRVADMVPFPLHRAEDGSQPAAERTRSA